VEFRRFAFCHVGGDVSFFFSRHFGVGAGIGVNSHHIRCGTKDFREATTNSSDV
jgi:hypothetical protein